MSCSPFDLKDYFFGELKSTDLSAMEAHLAACRACREELDRLRLTQAALHALPEQEPPRRIAFVSDPVFRPRWWQVLWQSGPRLGFASAAMLSVALLVHTFASPARVIPPGSPPAAIDTAAIEQRVNAELAKRVDTAVRAALARSEAAQKQQTEQAVGTLRREIEFQRAMFEETITVLQKRYNSIVIASAEY